MILGEDCFSTYFSPFMFVHMFLQVLMHRLHVLSLFTKLEIAQKPPFLPS